MDMNGVHDHNRGESVHRSQEPDFLGLLNDQTVRVNGCNGTHWMFSPFMSTSRLDLTHCATKVTPIQKNQPELSSATFGSPCSAMASFVHNSARFHSPDNVATIKCKCNHRHCHFLHMPVLNIAQRECRICNPLVVQLHLLVVLEAELHRLPAYRTAG